jgi:hypothetical protein
MAFEFDHLFICTEIGAKAAERLVSLGLIEGSPSTHPCPPYLPKTLSIAVGNNSHLLTEPMLFQTPFGQRPDRYRAEKSQPLNHPLGLREITRVELVSPYADGPSPELQAVLDTHQLRVSKGADYSVELGFDRETQGHQIDFRPELPLIISY